MKTFILTFGCIENGLNVQILRDLNLDDVGGNPNIKVKVIKTHISNVFFLISNDDYLTEGKLSEYFRNLLFKDTALILSYHNKLDLFIKQVIDDSKAF